MQRFPNRANAFQDWLKQASMHASFDVESGSKLQNKISTSQGTLLLKDPAISYATNEIDRDLS